MVTENNGGRLFLKRLFSSKCGFEARFHDIKQSIGARPINFLLIASLEGVKCFWG